MRKKVLSIFLSVSMVSAMLAGCGSADAGTTEASKEDTAEAKTEETSESASAATSGAVDGGATAASNGMKLPEIEGGVLPLTISIADFNQSSEGTEVQKLWEEKMEAYLGVDLDITWQRTPFADYRNNELVVLQSGDVPDIASYTQGTAINEYGDDGIVLNLSDYSDYLHYYMDYVNDTNGGKDLVTNTDGSMYYFVDGSYNPQNIQGSQSFTDFAYRFDTLKDNDLEPATTLDEFTALCGNLQDLIDSGKSDADYVIMNGTKDFAFYRGFAGIFHTWDTLYWNGEKWAFGPIEDNFRDMLTYLNGLYEKGYIDPEIGTADANAATTKATTGKALICPTLWSGSASAWNTAATVDGMEWGLAYLPKNEKYGTPWKWGSKQPGKSLNTQMGIYISADCKYPEYAVAMLDYQYSDEMVNLLNWGVEGETYTEESDGTKTYVDSIMNSDSPSTEVANYGIMSSAVCRTGIPFTPQDFSAVILSSSVPEPWWNAEKGYYEGKYWVESDANGGEDSVSPADRPPVTKLTAEQSAAKEQLASACNLYANEYAYKFITGEKDVSDDAQWKEYVDGVKSQSEENFDDILTMMQENSVIQ